MKNKQVKEEINFLQGLSQWYSSDAALTEKQIEDGSNDNCSFIYVSGVDVRWAEDGRIYILEEAHIYFCKKAVKDTHPYSDSIFVSHHTVAALKRKGCSFIGVDLDYYDICFGVDSNGKKILIEARVSSSSGQLKI